MVTSLANIFTMEKLVVNIIFGSKTYLLVDFQICCGHFTTFGKQFRMIRALFLPKGVSVKFWTYLLGKELRTNTQLHLKHGI